jgi:ATP-binding cassette subfamily B protein
LRKEEKSGQIFDFEILRRIYGFLQPYKVRFWSLVVLIMVMACVVPLNPLLIRHTIDNEIARGDYNGLSLMLWLCLGYYYCKVFCSL